MARDGRDDWAWPLTSLPEAIGATAREADYLTSSAIALSEAHHSGSGQLTADDQVERLAHNLGICANRVDLSYGDAPNVLKHIGPAVVTIGGDLNDTMLVCIVRSTLGIRGVRVHVLTPLGEIRRLPAETLVRAMRREAVRKQTQRALDLIESAHVSPRRRETTLGSLLEQWLNNVQVSHGWSLEPSMATPVTRHWLKEGLLKSLGALLVLKLMVYTLWAIGWQSLIKASLNGDFEASWLNLWGISVLTAACLQAYATSLQGRIATRASVVMRRQILHRAFGANPDTVRSQGVGQHLGRTFELESLEELLFGLGMRGIFALLQLPFAIFFLSAGPAAGPQIVTLAIVLLATTVLGYRLFDSRRSWTEIRRSMTHDLVERMLGHRTVLVQDSSRSQEADDVRLANYVTASERLDRLATSMVIFPVRVWIFIGFALLAAPFVQGTDPLVLASAIGGIMIGAVVVRNVSAGIQHAAAVMVVWLDAQSLFTAGRTQSSPEPLSRRLGLVQLVATQTKRLALHRVAFKHVRQAEPVFSLASLEITTGDTILVEGPSGSGKSTLCALIAGWRSPTSGMVMFGGLDRRLFDTSTWHRIALAVPQFHENHVLTGSLAFNVLMGRNWPPGESELQEAETLCRELGLGSMLDSMPFGIRQVVGDGAWQLSHGERSRVFIARALLQRTEILLLDESLGALDPESVRKVVAVLRNRARTLVLVAHP